MEQLSEQPHKRQTGMQKQLKGWISAGRVSSEPKSMRSESSRVQEL